MLRSAGLLRSVHHTGRRKFLVLRWTRDLRGAGLMGKRKEHFEKKSGDASNDVSGHDAGGGRCPSKVS